MIPLKQKTNGIYYLDVRLPDDETGALKRTRVSLDTRDKADAEQQRRDWLAGRHPKHPARGGVIAPKGKEVTPDPSVSTRACQKGLTVERWLRSCLDTIWNARKGVVKNDAGHRSNVKMLSQYLPGDLLLADITRADVEALEKKLWDAGYKPGSLQKLLNALSSSLTHATETINPDTGQPYLEARPVFPKITVKNVKDRVVTLDEENALLECLDERIATEPERKWLEFKMLITILADTGFRIGEALQLGPGSINRVRWLDPQTGEHREGIYLMLRQYTTKNDKPRQVPATQRVLDLLPLLNARANGGRWFPWKPRTSGTQYLLDNIRDDMKAKGFNIDDVTMHTWRHTCATRLALGGMDLVGLRDWLGHGDIKITAGRYIHLIVGHIYRGTSILDAYRAPLVGTGGSTEDAEQPSTKYDIQSKGNQRATPVTPPLH